MDFSSLFNRVNGSVAKVAPPGTGSATPGPAPIEQATDDDLRARLAAPSTPARGIAGIIQRLTAPARAKAVQTELDKRATNSLNKPYDYSQATPVAGDAPGSGLIGSMLRKNRANNTTPVKFSGGGFLGKLVRGPLNEAEAERVAQGNAALNTGLRGGLNNTGGFDFANNTRKPLR